MFVVIIQIFLQSVFQNSSSVLILRSFYHCLTGAALLVSIDVIKVYSFVSVFINLLIVLKCLKIRGGCAISLISVVFLIDRIELGFVQCLFLSVVDSNTVFLLVSLLKYIFKVSVLYHQTIFILMIYFFCYFFFFYLKA